MLRYDGHASGAIVNTYAWNARNGAGPGKLNIEIGGFPAQ